MITSVTYVVAECFCLIVFHYENDNVAMESRITRMGYEYRKLGHNKKSLSVVM